MEREERRWSKFDQALEDRKESILERYPREQRWDWVAEWLEAARLGLDTQWFSGIAETYTECHLDALNEELPSGDPRRANEYWGLMTPSNIIDMCVENVASGDVSDHAQNLPDLDSSFWRGRLTWWETFSWRVAAKFLRAIGLVRRAYGT